jgi:hypothetical protein
MNNIIGELLSKIMGGYFKLALSPQRQQPYSDELFSHHHKPFKQGLSFMILWLTEMHTRADAMGCDGDNRTHACSFRGRDVFRVARPPNLVSRLTRG